MKNNLRKSISLLLVIAMIISIAPITFTSVADESLTADVVYGTPEAIDGILDDGWAKAKTYESNKHNSSSPTDISAKWKIMYDSTYIYLFVTVTDSTVGDADYEKCSSNGDYWTKNTVQIYFDLGNEKSTACDANDFYIDINARGYFYAHYIRATSFVKHAAVVNDTGYTVEVAVDVGVDSDFKLEEGAKFGLDVWAADNILDSKGRTDFVSWTGYEAVYNNPSLMGTAVLGKKTSNDSYNGVVKGTNLKKFGATLTGITNASGGNMNTTNSSGNKYFPTLVVDGDKREGTINNISDASSADTYNSTYSDDLGIWFGVEFSNAYYVSQVIFWEGGHWWDGGWFGSSPVLQVYVNDTWQDVTFTLTPAYPGDSQAAQGDSYESYIFTLDESVKCSKVRVVGSKNSSAGHASVSEIEVYGSSVSAEAVYGFPYAIDGILDEGWKNANTYSSNIHYSATPTAISATWKLMYDSTNIYLFIDVLDSTIGDAEYEKCSVDGDYWTKNTVQIYFDLGNEKLNGYDSNAFYIDINARGYFYSHYIKSANFVDYAVNINENGYTVEVAVDVGIYSGFEADEGTKFGLDVWASDNLCTGNGRADLVSWTGYTDVYFNTSLMGTATLGVKPAGADKYYGVINGTNLRDLGASLTGITNASGGSYLGDIATTIVDGNKSEGQSYNTYGSTYSDELGVWFGVEFDKEYDISQVIFWEGGHWGDGGWFGSSPKLQVYSGDEWKDVDFTLTPEYPEDTVAAHGGVTVGTNLIFNHYNESYIFNLSETVTCSKVRVVGDKTSLSGGHASVSEIEVYCVNITADDESKGWRDSETGDLVIARLTDNGEDYAYKYLSDFDGSLCSELKITTGISAGRNAVTFTTSNDGTWLIDSDGTLSKFDGEKEPATSEGSSKTFIYNASAKTISVDGTVVKDNVVVVGFGVITWDAGTVDESDKYVRFEDYNAQMKLKAPESGNDISAYYQEKTSSDNTKRSFRITVQISVERAKKNSSYGFKLWGKAQGSDELTGGEIVTTNKAFYMLDYGKTEKDGVGSGLIFYRAADNYCLVGAVILDVDATNSYAITVYESGVALTAYDKVALGTN